MELTKGLFKKIAGLLTLAAALWWISQNLALIPHFIGRFASILSPLILGVFIGFILNIPTAAIEKSLFSLSWGKHDRWRMKLKRPLSLVFGLLIVGGILSLILGLILPELVNALRGLAIELPNFFQKIQDFLKVSIQKHPELQKAFSVMNFQYDKVAIQVQAYIQNVAMSGLNATSNFLITLVSSFFVVILGIIFAIYGTLSKDRISYMGRKCCYALFSEPRADQLIKIVTYVVRTFTRYISAQIMEAAILGCLVFFGLTIFGFPYALILAGLVSICALIPIFGIYISGAVGCLLILIDSPPRALGFVLLLLAIQQFEGNVIYPNVVGNKVGLPPVLVFASVVLGGRFFGLWGLLLGVPVTSAAYALLSHRVHQKIHHKSIAEEKYAIPMDLSDFEEEIKEIEGADEDAMRLVRVDQDARMRHVLNKNYLKAPWTWPKLQPAKRRILHLFSSVSLKMKNKTNHLTEKKKDPTLPDRRPRSDQSPKR